MTDHEHFNIQRIPEVLVGEINRCPVCGDGQTTNFLAVCNERGEPLCDDCAREKDESLAGVLVLCNMIAFSREPRGADGPELKLKKPDHEDFLGPLADRVAGRTPDRRDGERRRVSRRRRSPL